MCVALCSCEPDVYDRARMQERLNKNTNAPLLLKLKQGTQVGHRHRQHSKTGPTFRLLGFRPWFKRVVY